MGELDINRGDFTGELSSGGSLIKGTYTLTEGNRTGTWQAERE